MTLLSHYEFMVKRERNHQKETKELTKRKDIFNLMRDIGTAWQLENPDRTVYQYACDLDLYRVKEDKLSCIQYFLDDLEDNILYDWKLDLDRGVSIASQQSYYYNKPESDFLKITFQNLNCRIIETGKMIPEVMMVCDEEQ